MRNVLRRLGLMFAFALCCVGAVSTGRHAGNWLTPGQSSLPASDNVRDITPHSPRPEPIPDPKAVEMPAGNLVRQAKHLQPGEIGMVSSSGIMVAESTGKTYVCGDWFVRGSELDADMVRILRTPDGFSIVVSQFHQWRRSPDSACAEKGLPVILIHVQE